MVWIGQDELLLALKRFKGLAKQDLLISELSPQPDYWKTHAEARRQTYAKLIELVEQDGTENACVFAFTEYQKVPNTEADSISDPALKGMIQAIEMFFKVIGIETEQLRWSKFAEFKLNQFLDLIPKAVYDSCIPN